MSRRGQNSWSMTSKVSACFDGMMIRHWNNFTFTLLCSGGGGGGGGGVYFHNLKLFSKSDFI